MARLIDWRQELAAPIQALQDELRRVIATARSAAPGEVEAGNWIPSVDLVETSDVIRLWIDLPGVPASAIDLTVNGPLLTLQGRREPIAPGQDSGERLLERPVGTFHRQIPLPCEVDLDAIQAETRDGVLEVVLPKAETVRPRSIPIRPG